MTSDPDLISKVGCKGERRKIKKENKYPQFTIASSFFQLLCCECKVTKVCKRTSWLGTSDWNHFLFPNISTSTQSTYNLLWGRQTHNCVLRWVQWDVCKQTGEADSYSTVILTLPSNHWENHPDTYTEDQVHSNVQINRN